MSLLSLASSGLSTYIWLITFWDVYRPLSSTIASHAPSFNPLSFFSPGDTPDAQAQTPPRSKRSRVRLENAQREQIRSSLKAFLVWLMIKGMESLFDNSLGYILPLYNLSKIFALSFYVCFRMQISKLLFDSFIFPLGKPNAPLLDMGPLSNVVLPTMRFARIFIVIKNQVYPLVESWMKTETQESSIATTSSTQEQKASTDSVLSEKRIPPDLVPPPAIKPRATLGSLGSSTTSSTSDRGSAPRGSGGTSIVGERRIPIARKKASMDSLTSSKLTAAPQRSASVTKESLALLQTLPEAPRGIPAVHTFAASRTASGSYNGASASLKPFAFIPPSTPPSKSNQSQAASKADASMTISIPTLTPRMPGFLTGQQDQALLDKNASSPSESSGQRTTSLSTDRPPKAEDTAAAEPEAASQGSGITHTDAASSSRSGKTNGVRRKRTDDADNAGPARKSRASPSKASRGLGQTTATEAQMKKSASTRKVASNSEGMALKPSDSVDKVTTSRSRRRAV